MRGPQAGRRAKELMEKRSAQTEQLMHGADQKERDYRTE